MVDNKMLFNDLCTRSRVRIVDDEARYVIEELYSIGIAFFTRCFEMEGTDQIY